MDDTARVAVYLDFDNIVISRYDNVHGDGSWRRDDAWRHPSGTGDAADAVADDDTPVGAEAEAGAGADADRTEAAARSGVGRGV